MAFPHSDLVSKNKLNTLLNQLAEKTISIKFYR